MRRDIRLLIIIVRVSGETVEQAAQGRPVPIGSAWKPSRSISRNRTQAISMHCEENSPLPCGLLLAYAFGP